MRRSQILLATLILIKVISYTLVLFPISLTLGQGIDPWLIAHGKTLYVNIIDHRPPLIAYLIAFVQPLFGGNTLNTALVLHILTICVSLLGVYVVSIRLTHKPLIASLSILYFAALDSVFNNVLFTYEVALGLIYCLIMVCLLDPTKITRLRLLIVGMLMGLSCFVKPQTVFVGGVIGLWLLVEPQTRKRVAWYVVGGVIPVAAIWGAYFIAGMFKDYWYWNFTFNQRYGFSDLTVITGDFIRRMLLIHIWLVPLALLAWQRFRTRDSLARYYGLLIGMCLVTFAFQLPRSGEMHAAAGLPMVSIAAGIVIATLWHDRRESLMGFGLAVGVVLVVAVNVATSYIPTPAGFRAILGVNDLQPVVDWLDANSAANDSLFVIPEGDSTSQLHVFANRLPPDTYAILNEVTLLDPQVQNRLLSEWQRTPPDWIVYFPAIAKKAFPASAQPLLDYLDAKYVPLHTIPNLLFYGDAIIYHRK